MEEEGQKRRAADLEEDTRINVINRIMKTL